MRIRSLVLAFTAIGLLAACEMQGTRRPGDVNQADFDAARRIIKADPARRQVLVHDCRANMRMKSKKERGNIAALMKVSLADVPAVFCDRTINAADSGRLTAADTNSFRRGEISPKMIAILQGE
jgi:hypothetical protein